LDWARQRLGLRATKDSRIASVEGQGRDGKTGLVGMSNGIFRLSTDAFAERDRTEIWHETIGRAVMSLDIDPLRDASSFHADITLRVMPGLVFSEGTHAGMRYDRSSSMIDSDDLVLSVVKEGQHVVRQFGREFAVSAGEAVLTTSADPGVSFNHATERLVLFRIPQDRIKPLVGDFGGALVQRIDRSIPALQMLLGYSAVLASLPSEAPPDLQHLMATHVCDLIALTLGATRDAAQTAAGRGVRAARLSAIKRDIAENIGRRDLTAEGVAAKQGISAGYLRKLFEAEGTNFTDFVRRQRILRAHRLLTDPRFASSKISAIAYDVGFSDLSYFNRVFRQHYGCTPSEARERAPEQSE
jgi:AraC-like DNA-binding protein